MASSMELADDGNVYLMRHSPTGPVYVIAPSGQVLKRIALSPPEGSYLSEIKVSHQELAAEYIRPKPSSHEISAVVIQIVDLQSGEPVAEYSHADGEIGSAFACYSADNLTFLVKDDKGSLMIAQTAITP